MKDLCPMCQGPKDVRATSCRRCVVNPGNRTGSGGPTKRTSEQWVAFALETAEPYGDGCLLATAWRPQPKGYIRVARSTLLHRLVAEVKIGRPLTGDETVDHTCHNADSTCPGGNTCPHRRCINADHLEVVDAITNWSRGGLGVVAQRRALEECPAGHPYAGRNLYVNYGWRTCRACKRARAAGRDPRLEPALV